MVAAAKRTGYMIHEAIDISMTVDYFTIDGLSKKTGMTSAKWNLVILKELIDNALDAIEPLPEKKLVIEYDSGTGTLSVYDNGRGIKADTIENSIYNFSVYHSSKRHFVTPSRGKQGNGLKTVICICCLQGYDLLWHTAEGQLVRFLIDDTRKEYGEIAVKRQDAGQTKNRGVTVKGFEYPLLSKIVREYAECNPDVNIVFRNGSQEHLNKAGIAPVDRSGNTNIAFYDLTLFKSFLGRQDGSRFYKGILQETFGTAIANKSTVKGKLEDIDINSPAFAEDFQALRRSQEKKQFTALKLHMTGLDRHFFTVDRKTGIPYCVEFTVKKLPGKAEDLRCRCYVNNTVTYEDAISIRLSGLEKYCRVGSRKPLHHCSYNLRALLLSYLDYSFTLHFISPQLSYMDTGKVTFDISGIAKKLCEELTRAINREQRQYRAAEEKPPSKRELMRAYLPDAFKLASSGGKYSITARQLYYKVRELSGIDETENTYADFTQNILTEWLERNPAADEKVFFSDRGNFYIGTSQEGLGTGNVRKAIGTDGKSRNQFLTFGGLTENIYLQPDFDIRYRYDKALYIEKTGFDNIFKAEHIADKHHMIIVSGQGFGTRAAKALLYHLQGQGLKLYCLHDLDYSGVSIINALRESNEKFPEPLQIEDLGITIEDVQRYKVTPERVNINPKDYAKIDQNRYTPQQQKFFFCPEFVQRVELNAFTTEQILEIIDRKLSKVDMLPRLKLSQAVSIDPERLKEVALMRLLKKRFGHLVAQMPEPDIAGHDDILTVYEAQARTEGIINSILQDMEQAADEKLNDLLEQPVRAKPGKRFGFWHRR